jgi:hypothetical protein
MPTFDRFDICEAHLAIEQDYHSGGILHERPSNQRRNMSTDYQLHRLGFKPGHVFNGFASLSENGREIYRELQERYGFPCLTSHDLDHARETWEALQEPCDAPECQITDGNGEPAWPECDCHNSEIIMTSMGYVDVFQDGEVVANGCTLHKFEE